MQINDALGKLVYDWIVMNPVFLWTKGKCARNDSGRIHIDRRKWFSKRKAQHRRCRVRTDKRNIEQGFPISWHVPVMLFD